MRVVRVLALLACGVSAFASEIRDFSQADSLIERGDFVAAKKELEALRALLEQKSPSIVVYHERMGAVWLREGKLKEARDSFALALSTSQRLKLAGDATARAFAGMGLCLLKENNKVYALKFFKKSLSHSPDEGTRLFVEEQIRELEPQ